MVHGKEGSVYKSFHSFPGKLKFKSQSLTHPKPTEMTSGIVIIQGQRQYIRHHLAQSWVHSRHNKWWLRGIVKSSVQSPGRGVSGEKAVEEEDFQYPL